MRFVLLFLCLATPALAQQLVPPPPADIVLGVCQQERSRVANEKDQAWAYVNVYLAEKTQLAAEIAELKKKLAEAETKVPKSDQPAEAAKPE